MRGDRRTERNWFAFTRSLCSSLESNLRTIQVYLEQATFGLWRVARFTLRDFLELPRDEGDAEYLSPVAEDCLVLKPKPPMMPPNSHEAS